MTHAGVVQIYGNESLLTRSPWLALECRLFIAGIVRVFFCFTCGARECGSRSCGLCCGGVVFGGLQRTEGESRRRVLSGPSVGMAMAVSMCGYACR